MTAERLQEISEELISIGEELQAVDTSQEDAVETIDNLEERSTNLINERNQIMEQRKNNIINKFNENPNNLRSAKIDKDFKERMGRDLMQQRAITLGGNLTVNTPENVSPTLNPAFSPITRLIDLVTFTNLPGGETYKKGYMKKYDKAGTTAEGTKYKAGEMFFGSSEITKTKHTILFEVSEEFKKLAPGAYYEEVVKTLQIALKTKLAEEIVNGAGGSGKFTGILASDANQTNIDPATNITLKVIDENTLNEILFAYGGEEDVYPGTLVLNKQDLADFSRVRGSDKKPVYEIDIVNQTINQIPYVISSSVKAFKNAATNDKTMFFGSLSNYEVGQFSDVEVQESIHAKFAEGIITLRASVMLGGNVVKWNGFVRTVKGTAPAGVGE